MPGDTFLGSMPNVYNIDRILGIFCLNRSVGNEGFNNGRQEGIRTLEAVTLTRVPGVRLQPLGHLSTF